MSYAVDTLKSGMGLLVAKPKFPNDEKVHLPDSEIGDGADESDAVEWLLETVDDEHSDRERLFDNA